MKHQSDRIPAALYARFSSDRQDVDLSVAAQLRALREFAERNGYVVAREYIDEAESGRVADRPQFRKMLRFRRFWSGSSRGLPGSASTPTTRPPAI